MTLVEKVLYTNVYCFERQHLPEEELLGKLKTIKNWTDKQKDNLIDQIKNIAGSRLSTSENICLAISVASRVNPPKSWNQYCNFIKFITPSVIQNFCEIKDCITKAEDFNYTSRFPGRYIDIDYVDDFRPDRILSIKIDPLDFHMGIGKGFHIHKDTVMEIVDEALLCPNI